MVGEIIIALAKVIFVVSVVLTLVPVLIWWERKGAAYIQDRRGPNRANIAGIRLGGFIHNFADALKLFFKEDIIPARAHKIIYVMAPALAVFVTLSVAAVIPFAAPARFGDTIIKFQIADLNIGVLYIAAIASLSVYSVLLAGWSSGSGYSLLGGIRASSQMISYEVAMGLALIGVIIYAGTVRLDEIVALQGVVPWDWNFCRQPLACLIFLICLFAEANRNPFDLPEGESELVAGYHTEYSSMKFALFFMAEYAHMAVGSMIFVALFWGGWQVPFLSTEALNNFWTYPLFTVIVHLGAFLVKVLFWCWFFIWVRWTLPRFRFDQLMRLGWTVLLPLALINLVITAIWLFI